MNFCLKCLTAHDEIRDNRLVIVQRSILQPGELLMRSHCIRIVLATNRPETEQVRKNKGNYLTIKKSKRSKKSDII